MFYMLGLNIIDIVKYNNLKNKFIQNQEIKKFNFDMVNSMRRYI